MGIKMVGRFDALVCIALFVMITLGAYVGSAQLNSDAIKKANVWFQADIGRVYSNMTERDSNHYRTKVHPLFSLSTAPAVHVLSKLGMPKADAVRLLVACVAGLGLVLLYLVLRHLGIRLCDSIFFSILASFSSASIFWAVVPETFIFGSVTVLAVVLFLILAERRSFASGYFVGVGALSLSMTVTNWMAGIVAAVTHNSPRTAVKITIDAFVVVTVLWAIQRTMFPSAEFFLFSAEEKEYVLLKESGGLIEKATVFFLHSMVMPEVQVLFNRWADPWPLLSVQFSKIGSGGLFGWAATLGWLSLLVTGSWAAWRNPAHKKFKLALAAIICGQLFLHMIYGDETFLYSPHWVPLLIIVAAFSATLPYRRSVLTLAAVTSIALVVNNLNQFEVVASELWSNKYGTTSR